MAPSLGLATRKTENRNSSGGLRKRDIISYALLPRILPRFGDLFLSGFGFFAFFMAQVYRGVRLLPEGHPSLNPSNIGTYGVRDVIGEAARHLVWKRENIDQILVFLAILMGLILIALQAATFIVAFAIPQATAADFGFSSIFGTPPDGSSQDMAFILLDRVFGVPGIFDSCIANPDVPCYGVSSDLLKFDKVNTVYKPDVFPWPYHYGLHTLFQFYSTGLLLVGVFILLYYVIVIVAETAQTGTPFGKRFNTVWAPIRLVMAFGLLIPISSGLNSAQYITLYAAKWGSNFATNGWRAFNATISEKADNMAQNLDMAVRPKSPEMLGLLQFMTLAHTCKVYEETIMKEEALASDASVAGCGDDLKGRQIEAYIVKPGVDAAHSQVFLREKTYEDALKFSENNDIQIRFGDRNCKKDYAMAGNVEPVCGEITLPINSLSEAGAQEIQKGYYQLIQYLWGGFPGTGGTGIASYRNTDTDTVNQKNACIPAAYNKVLNAHAMAGGGGFDLSLRTYALSYFQNGPDDKGGQCKNTESAIYKDFVNLGFPKDDPHWIKAAEQHYMYGDDPEDTKDVSTPAGNYSAYENANGTDYIVTNIIKRGVLASRQAVADGKYNVSDENLQRGWAVAGIWYNKIAEMNGSLIGAAWDIPMPNRYPQIMMTMLTEKKQNNAQTSADDMFCPNVAGGDAKTPIGTNGTTYAQTMCMVYSKFNNARPQQSTGNVMGDFINAIFGTQGLFDLRNGDNSKAHPLAQLVGVGKGLIEASIRNLGIGLGSGLAQIVAGLVTGGQAGPELLGAISSFFFTIATMTLTAGFILYYVIPFLPFLYFFFAVGNWLKGVFEAMVGVPLWALAHLRIDGNGLPGDAAINGYYMLFEIFLRPIIILFGFLASISIFAAMASVLNVIFDVAVNNLTGTHGSGAGRAIDSFFYTVMYAVIMYIMALSSFKLIDLVPNQIMRWMGSSVSTFSDMQQDVAGSLTQYTAIAGSQITSQIGGGLQGAMGKLSGGAQQLNQALFRK